MNVLVSSQEIIDLKSKLAGKPLALVPTMGALHNGHLKLAEEAKQQGCYVLVSIFVNPRQFNNAVDLDKYPRTEDADRIKLEATGVDAVFIPNIAEVYTDDLSDINLDLGELGNVFEGHFRPGHFDGVVQVLYRFFMKACPDCVFFGEKDLQQCMVVKKLIQAYFPNISFFQIPTVRDVSGLAMSSRNQRLSKQGLDFASAIYRNLVELKKQCLLGDFDSVEAIENLRKLNIETEYLEWVSLPNLSIIRPENFRNFHEQALVFAGYLEGVRLIDNLVFTLQTE